MFVCFLRVVWGAPQFPSLSIVQAVLGLAALLLPFAHDRTPTPGESPSPWQSSCSLKATASQSALPEQTKGCDQPSCVFQNPAVPRLLLLLPAEFPEERATLTLPGWFASAPEHHFYSDTNILIPVCNLSTFPFSFLCRTCIQTPFLSQLTQLTSTLSSLSSSPTTPQRSTRCSSHRGCPAGQWHWGGFLDFFSWEPWGVPSALV